jgi:UDPglucose 6-dehydrogenase
MSLVMHICVIGTGHVGLAISAALARMGHQVTCVDEQEAEYTQRQSELAEIVPVKVGIGRLKFVNNLHKAIADSQIIFIALDPLPSTTEEYDMGYVESLARKIGFSISGKYKVIVNRSIPFFGIKNSISKIISEEISKRQLAYVPKFDVVDHPNVLGEEITADNIINPIALLLGTNSQKAIATLKQLYTSSRNWLERQTLHNNSYYQGKN